MSASIYCIPARYGYPDYATFSSDHSHTSLHFNELFPLKISKCCFHPTPQILSLRLILPTPFVPGSPLPPPRSSPNLPPLPIQTLNPLTQTPNQKSPTPPKSRTRTLILSPRLGPCNSEGTTKSKPQSTNDIPESDVPA